MNGFVTNLVCKNGDLKLAAAAWRLGLLDPIVTPRLAQDALVLGHDSEMLVRLAGEVKPTAREVGELIERAFVEVLGEMPSNDQAVKRVCDAVARAVMDASDADVLVLLNHGTTLMVRLGGKLHENNLLYLLDDLHDQMAYDSGFELSSEDAVEAAREVSKEWLKRNLSDDRA